MPLSPGDNLSGHYRVETEIGHGTYGRVYRARDGKLDRVVAIKELAKGPDDLGSSVFADYVRRFEREARVQAGFNHPNIVHVYDLIQDGADRLYLVMEYVDGTSLREQLAQRGPLPVDEAVRITGDLLSGLAVVHADPRDIVHRDIKPSNALLTRAGQAKLADFGLAQLGDESLRSGAGQPHPGTPFYMSPEQETTSAYLYPASDIFSVGCVLFEMLAGVPYKRARKERQALADLRPDTPKWLLELTAQALAKGPDERPANGGAMGHMLADTQAKAEARAKAQAETEAAAQAKVEFQAKAKVKAAAGARAEADAEDQSRHAQRNAEENAQRVGLAEEERRPGTQSPQEGSGPTTPEKPPRGRRVASPVVVALVAVATIAAGCWLLLSRHGRVPPQARVLTETPIPIVLVPSIATGVATTVEATFTAQPETIGADTVTPLPPEPTASSALPDMATATAVVIVNADGVNVRDGPGTDFRVTTSVNQGDQLQPLGRLADDSWIQVRLASGDMGWVAASYLDLSGVSGPLPVVPAPQLPTCTQDPAPQFASLWHKESLGCAQASGAVAWATLQQFEHGMLLWREDTNQVYLLTNSGTWFELLDRWQDGTPITSRGNPPAGLQSPVRGFGYVWGKRQDVFDALGWATDKEKGFCAVIQPADHGLAVGTSTVQYCKDQLYNYAVEPDWPSVVAMIVGDGTWYR